ncbi:hypothetical protein ACQ4PT_002013 [Festuca glaucescens]
MVSMAAAAKIAVLLAVAALFAAAGADDPQARKEAGCWQCYSTCMHKCDGYADAPLRSANRTEPAAHIAVDDGAAAATGTVHSTDGAVADFSDSYDDKGDDEDEDEDEDDDDKDKDKDKDKDDDKDDKKDDDDEDEDEDDDDNHRSNGGKDYFTCKKKCIVDCYKDLPPVCYKMCIAETCLKLPTYKQGDCFKACGHKCFHKHPRPKPKPGPPSPKPKPPSPKPPTPPKPTPTPPKPTPTPPKPTPPQLPPCPKRCPPKPKPKPPPKRNPPCPPAAKKAPEGKVSRVSVPCAGPGGCRPDQATNDTSNSNN